MEVQSQNTGQSLRSAEREWHHLLPSLNSGFQAWSLGGSCRYSFTVPLSLDGPQRKAKCKGSVVTVEGRDQKTARFKPRNVAARAWGKF